MKKLFFKISKISLVIFLLICSIFTSFNFNTFNNNYSYALDNNNQVVFYGSDRLTSLLSYDNFPYGVSLSEYQNYNIIKNSSFVLNSSNQKYWSAGLNLVPIVDDWGIYNCSFEYFSNKVVVTSTSSTGELRQNFGTSLNSALINNSFNYIVSVDNVLYTLTFSIDDLPTTTTNYGYLRTNFGSIRLTYNSSRNEFIFYIYILPNHTHVIDYVALYNTQNNIDSYFDLNYLKKLYFNNQTEFENINDFDLVFTDNYYSYNNYFNENYIVLNSQNLYCVALNNNFQSVDSSQFSSFNYNFTQENPNLLNQINIDSIKFNLTECYPLDNTPLYTLHFTQQNPNIPLNQYIFNSFIDYFNNTYYYKIYGYISGNYYLYDIYLYRVNLTNFENICFYPCPPELFIIDNYYMKNFYTYTYYDTRYYFKYNINFNMNYYYADYFSLFLGFGGPSRTSNFIFYDNNNKSYFIGDIGTTPFISINSDLMLNSYINSFSMVVKMRTQITGLPVTEDFYYQLFNEVGGLKTYNPKVYYFQSNNQSNGNNIIPTDTSGLYKQKQNWWDFGTDIYNMFVYIIFEAPILSNITELIYLIIALIINTILTIIGLFSSVENTIFIAMILGFLLFKFVTKKFLGGS